MLKKILFILLVSVFFCDCNQKNSYWQEFHQKGKKNKTLRSQLQFDTITMEDVNSSSSGNFVCDGEEILYLDKKTKVILHFDLEGHKKATTNGFGQGPNEFVAANSLLVNNRAKVVLGDFATYYLLDDSFDITKKGVIDWGGTATQEEIYNAPKSTMPEIYEIIEYENFPCLLSDSIVLLPVNTEHFKYNGFRSLDYYKESHIFALLDLKSGHIKGLKGRRSPEYLKYSYLPNFDFFHFDCDDTRIYVSYDIDSTIYVLDKQFHPQFKFGYAGSGMNCNYKPTNSYEEAEGKFLTDRATYGHYSYLKYIKETGLLFRTYTKGGKKKDGLQVYDSQYNLIADIDVPQGLRVIGYHNGKYLAECSEGLNAIPMYILCFTF